MEATKSRVSLTYDEQWALMFAHKEALAAEKPSWLHLAKSAWPELYWEARILKDDLEKEEADTNSDSGEKSKTTKQEKWTAVEAQLRHTMPQAMVALEAFQEHVDIWTICDPATIAKLLKGASTEQERFDIILGTQTQALLEDARATLTNLGVRTILLTSGREAQNPPCPDESGDDSDDSVTFITTPVTKSARRKAAKERRKARQAAEEAALRQEASADNAGEVDEKDAA